MMVVVVMMMVMMMMVVMMMVMMVMVMMVMVMVILGHYHRLFFRDGGVAAALVLGAQNFLGIRNGIQQLGK